MAKCFFCCFLSVQSLGFPALRRAKLGKSLSPKANIFLRSRAAAPVTASRKKLRTRAGALFQFLLAQSTARISHRTKRPVLVIGPISRFTMPWSKVSDADGSRILPVMPYEAYSGMAQEDLKALIAYLRTLKAVKKATPPLKNLGAVCPQLGTPLVFKSIRSLLTTRRLRHQRAESKEDVI